MNKHRLFGGMLAILFALNVLAHENRYNFKFTAIDHPNAGGLTYVLGINNRGDVSGTYLGLDGKFHGYARLDGAFYDIDVPDAAQTACGGIRDDRLVTGTYFDQQGFQHGFQWKNGTFTRFDVPGAAQTTDVFFEFGTGLGTAGYRTNQRGAIVGQYADEQGYGHGYILRKGQLTTLDFPGAFHIPGYDTTAIAINDANMVGGSYSSELSPHVHGFLYQDGKYHGVDAPEAGGEFGTQINGLNNAGAAVGPYTDADNVLHGFIWQAGKFATVDVPWAVHSEVDSINDRGDISGTWYDADGGVHGYIGKRIEKSHRAR